MKPYSGPPMTLGNAAAAQRERDRNRKAKASERALKSRVSAQKPEEFSQSIDDLVAAFEALSESDQNEFLNRIGAVRLRAVA